MINSADFHENINQINKQILNQLRNNNDPTDITSTLNHQIENLLAPIKLKSTIDSEIKKYQKFLDFHYPPSIVDINPSYSVGWNKEQLANAGIDPWHAYIFHTKLPISNSTDFLNYHIFKTTLLILSAKRFHELENYEASWALLYEFHCSFEQYKTSIESGQVSSPEWRSRRAQNASKARTQKYKAIDEKLAYLIKKNVPKSKWKSMKSVCSSLSIHFKEEQKINKSRIIEDILYNRLTNSDSVSRKAYFENCMDKYKKKDYLSHEEQI